MDNLDLPGISSEKIDLIGCVIPRGEEEEDVYIGFVAPKYLMKPYKHCKIFYKSKESVSQTG